MLIRVISVAVGDEFAAVFVVTSRQRVRHGVDLGRP